MDDSLAIILPFSTTSTESRGHPRTELALLTRLSILLLSLSMMLLDQQTIERGGQHKEDRSSPPGLQRTREQKQSSRTAESSGTEAVLQDCRELGNRGSPPGLQKTREQRQSSRTAESSGTEAVLQDCRELRNRGSPPGLQKTREQRQSSRTAGSTGVDVGTSQVHGNRREDLKHAEKKDQAKSQYSTTQYSHEANQHSTSENKPILNKGNQPTLNKRKQTNTQQGNQPTLWP
ncbi:hypothetical protein D4764_06G0007930 [Takifugu flavidus]|uniref:Uncharacterized protein n=1 Tax=Takifugu flavidus TaxID=433684 RepID=A0A5C6MW78_9TELE|nr:hypothetical protein D4764_06G0007930 [Takifugu flavidus]